MIASDFVPMIDCAGSTGSARAVNRPPEGGPGGADEDAGLADGDSFSHRFASLGAELQTLIEGKADLTQRLVIGQFDELGELVDTINMFIEKPKNLLGSPWMQAPRSPSPHRPSAMS